MQKRGSLPKSYLVRFVPGWIFNIGELKNTPKTKSLTEARLFCFT